MVPPASSDDQSDQESFPTVEATARSLEILRSLKEEGPAPLTEIAVRLDYSKSTVHRHLATLEREGYIVEGEEGYQIGLVYLDYGIDARDKNQLYRAAKKKIDNLAARIEDNVWLMVEENGFGMFLYHATDESPVQTFTREGYQAYLHVFAGGKAILAHMSPNRVEDILDRRGLPAQNEQTITDREELFAELEQVRDRGVAFNRKEAMRGVHAVAVPVIDPADDPLGSIVVAGPANRLKDDYLETELPELLLGIANEIEVNLTYG